MLKAVNIYRRQTNYTTKTLGLDSYNHKSLIHLSNLSLTAVNSHLSSTNPHKIEKKKATEGK